MLTLLSCWSRKKSEKRFLYESILYLMFRVRRYNPLRLESDSGKIVIYKYAGPKHISFVHDLNPCCIKGYDANLASGLNLNAFARESG